MASRSVFFGMFLRPSALFAIAVLASLATGCSGGDSGRSAKTPAAQPTPAAAASAPDAPANGGGVALGQDARGPYVVGAEGRTLYFFANDTAGVSRCTGGCASQWPPLTVAADATPAGAGVAGSLAAIMREDGSHQVALDGKPLYYFAGDTAAGDENGDGLGGVWSVARPGLAGAVPGGGTAGTGTTTTSNSVGDGY